MAHPAPQNFPSGTNENKCTQLPRFLKDQGKQVYPKLQHLFSATRENRFMPTPQDLFSGTRENGHTPGPHTTLATERPWAVGLIHDLEDQRVQQHSPTGAHPNEHWYLSIPGGSW